MTDPPDETRPLQPPLHPFEISVQSVAEKIAAPTPPRLLDVREQWEWDIASIHGSELLTEPILQALLERGDRDAEYIFVCHLGIRSLSAAAFFADRGFTNVRSMTGGIARWSTDVDPTVPTY